ncbi:MAG: cation diffusion facilitator family transporter [Pseudoflavonifractor capillosus]|uniref:cation diffusion facilitator family transporter n=1 Tax=Pseudoflavonifractor capillosus TaxID=106588 RepID=UPI0023F99067|nr:cation diffusion facilitator family transporter [Pseudoflavonifractor capillosus]MCI5928713.1 cation diffusion facilitator family transporter [Pseudoflavonifractor capillosus]MDY4661600.1 cation diffusion facilitator family transporter [Pseudoflavonifractor capillosus]
MINLLVKTFVKDAGNVQDPQVRQRYGTLSGAVGIFLNLLLSAGKMIAGLITGSIAITADAFNNLTDAVSSVVTLVGFRMAGKQADDDHPFGHGRIEYLSGLAVSVVILLVGLELAKSSVEKIIHPEQVEFSWLSAGILIAAICVKLWMSYFNRSLSRRIGSAAMAATATDSLSDAVATSAVLLSAIIGKFTGVNIDAWAGILVALFILRAGWGAAKDTLNPLLGQSPDPELVRDIERTVLAHPQVVGIHDMIIHDYGPGRSMMSLHAEVPAGSDIMEVHDEIDAIERELKAKYHIDASIHMDPIVTGDETISKARKMVSELVREVDPAMTIHDFRMTSGPRHRNLIFDVVVPYSVKSTDDEVRREIERKIRAADPNSFAVIQIDRAYTQEPG